MKKFRELVENSICGVVEKSTIIGLARSILMPLAENNPQSMVFARIRNREDLSGLIKRLEYSKNVEMYNFFDEDIVKRDDFVEIEFILLTSPRFSSFLAWDYSECQDKNKSKVYFLMNSKLINDSFDELQKRSKIEFSEEFYSYKPERRDNKLMNEALANIVGILNENISENEYKNKEEIKTAKKLEGFTDIKSCCHEIKNQLSILDVYTKLIENETGQNKNTEMLRKAASLIAIQLNEIQGLSTDDSRQEDITSIIKKSIETINESAKAAGNKITFTNNAPDFKFDLSYEKFLIILTNILKNANESTKDDNIEIELRQNNDSADILVRNHGAKIPDNVKNKIFEEGFTTKENGWGIGLSICQKYLAKENAKIKLTHSDDDYTEFLIEIPINLGLDDLGIYL